MVVRRNLFIDKILRAVLGSAGPADVAGAAGILVQTPEVSELEIALLRLVLAAFTIGS